MKWTLALMAFVLCVLNMRSYAQNDTSHDEFISVEQEPTPIHNIQSLVQYPEEAKRKGLEGGVIVAALIGVDGKVIKTEIVKSMIELKDHQRHVITSSENALFTKAAQDAVMKALFIPAKQNGRPVKIWYTIPVSFSLSPPVDLSDHGEMKVMPVGDLTSHYALDTNGVFEYNKILEQQRKEEYIATHPPNPKLIGDVSQILEYPDDLKKLKISGRVRFSVVLDTAGDVAGHHIEYSDNLFLEEPVKNAIVKMKFEKPSAPSQYSYEIMFEGDSVSIR